MAYLYERQMYLDVANWLRQFLRSRFKTARVEVYDTHRYRLNEVIARKGFQSYFTRGIWQTYDIRADVTGFIISKERLGFVLIECKIQPITIAHLSQLLGYCRVSHPVVAFLISTSGIGEAVNSLILSYGRTDILEYYWERNRHPRALILTKWDSGAKSIDMASVLPPGAISNPIHID